MPLFHRPFLAKNTVWEGAIPLWKTTLLPVDFSTVIQKSFPQVVGKSVDISAISLNFPHKIRQFEGFSRLKSNFWGVDNHQTVIIANWSFPQGREAKQRDFG